MGVITILLANGFFLLILLIILFAILFSNGNTKQAARRVKEDLAKIKEQID